MERGAGAGGELPVLPDASNILLLAPADSERSGPRCLDALTQPRPGETYVLAVTYTSEPAAWVDAWNERVDAPPAGGSIVTIGGHDISFEDDNWAVGRLKHPGDLTGIGIELSDRLSGLADEAGPDDRVVACFDSVTALLQHADLQRSFRFLHVVTGRVRNVDAQCYYHLDPDAHDEQAIATLTGLFDTTVEYNGGDWQVTR